MEKKYPEEFISICYEYILQLNNPYTWHHLTICNVNGTIIKRENDYSGCNHISTTRNTTSCHSEINVIKKIVGRYIKNEIKQRRKLRKLKFFNFRIKLDSENILIFSLSKPCSLCKETLNSWNISKIFFTDIDGKMIKFDTSMETKLSKGERYN